MFCFIERISRISLIFLGCPGRILAGITWRPLKEPLISKYKIRWSVNGHPATCNFLARIP
jgi:hypothetical protein